MRKKMTVAVVPVAVTVDGRERMEDTLVVNGKPNRRLNNGQYDITELADWLNDRVEELEVEGGDDAHT